METNAKMKAVHYQKYGSPEVLHVIEVARPTPQPHEVLIKVHASTVSSVDIIFRKGSTLNARLFTGLFKPQKNIPGGDLAGEIVAIGASVKRFKIGDQIIASTHEGFGGHAEYISLPEDGAIAHKPETMSYAEAASIPYGALTALPFLRDTAKIQHKQKVLIIGASGSVGAHAVQLAKYFGAKVYGLSSTSKVELVQSLGADQVIDYSIQDYTALRETFDIIFDAGGKSSFSRTKHLLQENGIYLTTVLSLKIMFQMLWTAYLSHKKAKITFAGLRNTAEKVKDLNFLTELMARGKLKPIIDRSYPLEQSSQAHAYVEQGNKKGNVILSF